MTFHEDLKRQLLNNLGAAAPDAADQLNDALRMLGKWRSVLILETLLKQQGTVVADGPLAGLDFLDHSAEGCHIAKLLGTYEQPLHPAIEAAIQSAYPTILNIGCAEGYYAVGMARRMPRTRTFAFDIDPTAQAFCRKLAVKNGVADRVTVGALFRPEDFQAYAGQRVLVICDIEGGELALLDPAVSPALKHMDLIVESHECLVPGVTQALVERFSDSHDGAIVQDAGHRTAGKPAAQWFLDLPHLDQLLAVWEWRSGPTPWLVMRAKEPAGQSSDRTP